MPVGIRAEKNGIVVCVLLRIDQLKPPFSSFCSHRAWVQQPGSAAQYDYNHGVSYI